MLGLSHYVSLLPLVLSQNSLESPHWSLFFSLEYSQTHLFPTSPFHFLAISFIVLFLIRSYITHIHRYRHFFNFRGYDMFS